MHRIELEALKAKQPKAKVVRDLLQEGLARRSGETAPDALQSLVTLGHQLKAHGPVDLSTRLDDYLYDN
jgi:hypothetical protein